MSDGADSSRGMLCSGRYPELEDALCERVGELRRGRPFAPVAVVVGSAAVRTRVGDVLVRRLGGVANVSVVTLSRLALDLVTHAHGAPPAALAGLARERFVRRLIAAHAAELRYFGPVVERPHFAGALAATFADLREACVPPGPVWSRAVAAAPAGPGAEASAAKAADLDRLYGAYCADLEARGLLDGAGVQLAAARAAAQDDAGDPGAKTILYGIYDLNQAQEVLVGALIAGGADVLVPVAREGSMQAASAFQAALSAGLREAHREAPAAGHDRDLASALWRQRGDAPAERLAFDGDGTLSVVSVSDERAEMREAARAVVGAVETGCSSWDCAVVVPHADDVEPAAAALRAAGLRVACRRPDRSAGPRLLVLLADCLAPPAGEPFARRAVVDLLAAAPLRDGDCAPDEAALWLDEARQAGIVSGLDQWLDRMGRRRKGLERRLADLEARAPEAEAEDDEAVAKSEAVRRRLAAARGLEAAVVTLARACWALPERVGWGEWAEALATVLESIYAPTSSEAARDAASRLRSLSIVDERVDVADVAATLRELLAAGRVPEGRVGRDGVAVLTPLEVRGLSFSTVVFTGLAEGGFPSRGRPDPILGDAERRRVADATGVRIPLSEQRDAESLLLFAFTCEAARDRLLMLAPRSDAASGRPRLPSRLLLRLASLAAGRPVGMDEFLTGTPLSGVWRHAAGAPAFAGDVVWVDERERDTAALLALSQHGSRSAARSYLSAALGLPGSAERRLGAWRASRSPEPGAWDGLLGAKARAALAARHPFAAEMHPTRLERYIGCPFAFLLRDVMGLDAPDEPDDSLEMDAREFGTLAHGILQAAYERVIAAQLGLDDTLTAVVEAWESGCAAAEARGITGAALSWEVRREMLREDLLESVRRDPVFARGDGRPTGVEWRFGESVDRPVVLELDGERQVRFAGRLDRVDATSSGARVIDYKTGAGNTERNRIKEGLSVQLPVYQLAVRQVGGQGFETVASCYRLVTRRGGFEDLPLAVDEQTAAACLRELVAGAVELVDDGMFPRTTRGRCDYCDVRYACGTSAWARARKREHGDLDDVVVLQGPAAKGGGDGS